MKHKFKIGDRVKWVSNSEAGVITQVDDFGYCVVWDDPSTGTGTGYGYPINILEEFGMLVCPSSWQNFQEKIKDRLEEN